MKPHLTPAEIEAAYEFLRTRRPFRRWKLPDGDDIIFRVIALGKDHPHSGVHGHLWVEKGHPVLELNQHTMLTACTLVAATAHEMCHIRQWQLRLPRTHGAVFKKLKHSVCRWNGFDPGVF